MELVDSVKMPVAECEVKVEELGMESETLIIVELRLFDSEEIVLEVM